MPGQVAWLLLNMYVDKGSYARMLCLSSTQQQQNA